VSTAGETKTIVDHSGARVTSTNWRTYLVLLSTLANSARVVRRSVFNMLSRSDVERILRDWTSSIFAISKVTVVASGLEHVKHGGPCVLVSHHVSLLDTPCVIASFPGKLGFVGKIELSRVPVFGEAMRRVGVVFVDRKDLQKAIGQLEDAKRLVGEGYGLWVAAEGTRSRDGRLRTFKKGAFHIAIALGVPIVPVWIQGTLDVIRPEEWKANTGQKVVVAYGAPIATDGKSKDDIPALIAETRARMLELAQQSGAPADVDAGP
jgi:1-acyl-sn-glycerol-3-phosphate acyltransferase